MNDKFLNMLGLSKRAGKLSAGHDAAFESIQKSRACVCFIASDASPRLKDEFERTVKYGGRNVPYFEIPYIAEELNIGLGIRAAVLTVDDNGFAKRLIELLQMTEKQTGGN